MSEKLIQTEQLNPNRSCVDIKDVKKEVHKIDKEVAKIDSKFTWVLRTIIGGVTILIGIALWTHYDLNEYAKAQDALRFYSQKKAHYLSGGMNFVLNICNKCLTTV